MKVKGLLSTFLAAVMLVGGVPATAPVQVQAAEPSHTHVYHIAYNEVDHWRECTCGVSTTPMAHTFRWTTITEPTTSLTGFERGTCSTCGYVIEKEIPKKSPDHVHEYQITFDEVCHWRRCSCGAKTDSNPHHFSWAVIQEPGKYIAGLKRGTCTVCGYSKDVSIPSTHWTYPGGPNGPMDGGNYCPEHGYTGHICWVGCSHWVAHGCAGHVCCQGGCPNYAVKPGDSHIVIDGSIVYPGVGCPGTCTPFPHVHQSTVTSTYKVEHDASTHWTRCACGAITSKEFHNYSWSVVKDATDLTNGLRRGTCTVCGYQIDEVTPKLTHTHTLSYVQPKNATCTTRGRIGYYACSKCQLLYADVQATVPITEGDTIVRPLGHDLKYVAEVPATCTSTGHIPYYSCSTCKKLFKDEFGANEVSEANVLTKKAHAYVGEWQSNSKNHWQVCECGKTGNIAEHTLKLVGDKNADEYNEAYTGDTVCSVCKATVKKGKTLANSVITSAKRKINKVTVNVKQAKNASGYQIYLSTSKYGKYTRKLTLKSNSVTTGEISGLNPTKTYYVKTRSYVKANGTVYYGKFSTPKKLTKALGDSKVKKITVRGNQVKIDVSKATGASGYEVWTCHIKGGKYVKRMTFKSNSETQGIVPWMEAHRVHYVKVRPYVDANGKRYYGNFSKVVAWRM